MSSDGFITVTKKARKPRAAPAESQQRDGQQRQPRRDGQGAGQQRRDGNNSAAARPPRRDGHCSSAVGQQRPPRREGNNSATTGRQRPPRREGNNSATTGRQRPPRRDGHGQTSTGQPRWDGHNPVSSDQPRLPTQSWANRAAKPRPRTPSPPRPLEEQIRDSLFSTPPIRQRAPETPKAPTKPRRRVQFAATVDTFPILCDAGEVPTMTTHEASLAHIITGEAAPPRSWTVGEDGEVDVEIVFSNDLPSIPADLSDLEEFSRLNIRFLRA